MDEYVVGSVANIISEHKLCKAKSKKQQKADYKNILKHVDNEETVSKKIKNQPKNTLITTEKKENENPFYSEKELPFDNRSSEVKVDTITLKEKKEKEKTSLRRNVRDFPKKKKMKIDLLSLDHVPTDSEEEKDENNKIASQKCINLKKSSIYKDFKKNTVFVGNIPINYDKQKICRIFSKFGEIQNARIRCVPIPDINMSKRVAAIKKKFSPKRNSLVAYVKFKSQDSVNAALEANGMVIDGHHLRVDLAEENKERDNKKAIFVGGLPFDIEDDELWEFFKNCGKINSVRIVRDSQTSMGKGFGYINFDSSSSVELALKLDGQELKKKIINVKRYKKARNKNKLNSFGRRKSNALTSQLICKKSKKLKEKKKIFRKEKNETLSDFQGKTASQKQKKKKKPSKAALRQRKLVKILASS